MDFSQSHDRLLLEPKGLISYQEKVKNNADKNIFSETIFLKYSVQTVQNIYFVIVESRSVQ